MRFAGSFFIVVIALSSHVQARILDDYSLGSLNIIAGNTPVSQLVSGLDSAHTIGGSRSATAFGSVILRINHPSPTPIPQASFEQGIISLNGYGEFVYGNTSPLNVDLTADGANEFRVTLTGPHRAAYLEKAVLYLEAPDGMGGTYTASKTFSDYVTSSGNSITGHIKFSTFADLLTNVSKISLRFNGAPGVSGSPPFTVQSFVTAVPEPAIGVMALCAAVAITSLRRTFHA